MKIKLSLIAICLFTLCLTKVNAQQAGDPPPVAAEPSAATLKAAEEMLIAAHTDEQFDKNISAALNQFSGQIPADKQAAFTQVMKAFFSKYCSWAILKPALCKMYAQEFTELELKQLTAFYKTPLGTKLNAEQPILLQKGAALGQQAVTAHQSELQQMMAEAMQ